MADLSDDIISQIFILHYFLEPPLRHYLWQTDGLGCLEEEVDILGMTKMEALH